MANYCNFSSSTSVIRRQKIPELAQGLGKGIKNFKDAVKEGEEADVKTTEKIENQNTTSQTQTTEKKDINA